MPFDFLPEVVPAPAWLLLCLSGLADAPWLLCDD
jgi:hypothetical protein